MRAGKRQITAALAACGIGLLGSGSSAGAAVQTQSFGSTGAEQTFVVPAGVTSLHVILVGGTGGTRNEAVGGAGGLVAGDLAVTPGTTLYVEVGSNGSISSTAPTFNGGGGTNTASDATSLSWFGASGGGATDIRTIPRGQASATLGSRLAVAGGGGGGGGGGPAAGGTPGAGGAPGVNGGNSGGAGGQAGTATAGGDGGISGGQAGTAGSVGQGGTGGSGVLAGSTSGGGGGGGLFGGGGGGGGLSGGGGGGGGSSSLGPLSSGVTGSDTSGIPTATIQWDGPASPSGGGSSSGGGAGGGSVVPPSNAFTLGKATGKSGKITIRVDLPGPGKLSGKASTTVSTYRVATATKKKKRKKITYGAATKAVTAAGSATLTISPSSAAKKALKDHALKVAVTVTYTPTGGQANAHTVSVNASKTKTRRRR